MSEMVKRVARAMAALRNDADGGGAIMDLYGDLAYAAIAAMREPTDAMCNTEYDAPGYGRMRLSAGYSMEYAMPDDVWRAMIDAALKSDGIDQ